MQSKENESFLEKNHTLQFKYNDNLKKLQKILNTITEEKQDFTIERLFEMKEIEYEINFLIHYSSNLITVEIDDRCI